MAVIKKWPLVMSLLYVIVGVYCVQDVCEDVIANCSEYDAGVCIKFPIWAKLNCKRTCNSCKDCPDGWSKYDADKTCIKACKIGMDWESSKQECKKLGGELVIIRDSQKNSFVYKLRTTEDSHWIGMENVAVNDSYNKFRYVDGSPLGNYHPWIPNNPDNYGGQEKCVSMYVKEGLGWRWNDDNCQNRHPFICSKPFNS